jgi:tRNA(Ile2) C34 agmatinyltransferase TiaS
MTICFYNYCKTLNLKTRKQFLSSIDVEVMPFIGPWEIALIGGVVILIFLYRVLRKPKLEIKICNRCGRRISVNSKARGLNCVNCGEKLT